MRVDKGMGMAKRHYVGCEPWVFDRKKWVSQETKDRKPIRSYRDLDVFMKK